MKFDSKYKTCHSWKCIWKCRLRNSGNFIQRKRVKLFTLYQINIARNHVMGHATWWGLIELKSWHTTIYVKSLQLTLKSGRDIWLVIGLLLDFLSAKRQLFASVNCVIVYMYLSQGWGLLSQFPPFRCFPNISTSSKYMLAIECHFHIWQVLPQLSCGDTCQIWMWFKEFNGYFCEIENFAYGEIDERSFSNPHPRTCLLQSHSVNRCWLF